MKNLSIGLNVVLIIAVAVLYFFQFSDQPVVNEKKTVEDTVQTATADEYPVAYVNIDTLISEYDFYIDKRDALMQRRDESEAELQSETQKLEREFADFQNKINKGLITRTKAQMMQQELGKKEQNLYALKDNLTMQLAEEEQVMNRQVLDKIMTYLEEYNKDKGFRYILSNAFGGPVLFADKTLNVTQDVLKGLNEAYTEEQEEE